MIPRKILHGKISVIQDDPGKESGEGLSTWMVSREEDAIRQQGDASDGSLLGDRLRQPTLVDMNGSSSFDESSSICFGTNYLV